jgi:hypothetical protein
MGWCEKGHFTSGKYCPICNVGKTEKKEPRPLKKTPIKKSGKRITPKSEKQKKVTEEDIAFFKEIWAEREHKCQVTGVELGDEFNVVFFSHILTKGSYPRFRHYKKNLILMSFQDHQDWEFTDRKHPKWNPWRDLAEELIIEYYKK